eukprot:5741156-Prorocentrum_lima.AAC.1
MRWGPPHRRTIEASRNEPTSDKLGGDGAGASPKVGERQTAGSHLDTPSATDSRSLEPRCLIARQVTVSYTHLTLPTICSV